MSSTSAYSSVRTSPLTPVASTANKDYPFIKTALNSPFASAVIPRKKIRIPHLQGWSERTCIRRSTGSIFTGSIFNGWISDLVIKLFNDAKEQIFEDGIESAFAKSLMPLIINYSQATINAVRRAIFLGPKSQLDAGAEALRWIGELSHPATRNERLQLLHQCLFHPALIIRDAAVIGLNGMEDRESLPFLIKAIQNEKVNYLRDSMNELIEYLQK